MDKNELYWRMYELWYTIKRPFRDIMHGISNLWYYFPVIWEDRDWDQSFLLRLLHYKLASMEHSFRYDAGFVGSEKVVKDITRAKWLCERMINEDYLYKKVGYNKWVDPYEQDLDLFCKILRKHLREWWD